MSTRAHVFITLVSFASLVFILQLVRKRDLRAKYALLWLSVGSAMVLLAASPRILDRISLWLGIDYGPATLFLTAIVLLLLIAVHFSWELSRLEERTRILAEELALMKAERRSGSPLPPELP